MVLKWAWKEQETKEIWSSTAASRFFSDFQARWGSEERQQRIPPHPQLPEPVAELPCAAHSLRQGALLLREVWSSIRLLCCFTDWQHVIVAPLRCVFFLCVCKKDTFYSIKKKRDEDVFLEPASGWQCSRYQRQPLAPAEVPNYQFQVCALWFWILVSSLGQYYLKNFTKLPKTGTLALSLQPPAIKNTRIH